jgi:hypothetical protein
MLTSLVCAQMSLLYVSIFMKQSVVLCLGGGEEGGVWNKAMGQYFIILWSLQSCFTYLKSQL